MSVLANTDSYKLSHKGFMDEGTQVIYSNFTPRAGYRFNGSSMYDQKVVWFGLQHFIKDYLINEWNTDFFSQPAGKVISEFKRLVDAYLGPDSVPMEHFMELHKLGYLPIEIKALPEGSRVPFRVPTLTIQNTDKRFAWLTNYLETVMSCEIWKPMTTATTIYEYRRLVNHYAELTTGSTEGTEFQIHGFEFRGMSGRHDAAINGAAFLTSSCGTDTVPALRVIEESYLTDITKEFIATSVPATEHSVACLGTALKGELESYRRWITESYPTGIVSLVSDTYDYWKVLTEYLPRLKEDILARPVNSLGLSKVVIRPDCYDEETMILTNSGWKYFKDLTDHDLVAQVQNDEYSFIKPEKIIAQEYSGKMHHFKDHHGKVDLMVTPNHRMILEQGGKERIVFAEKLGKKGNSNQKMIRGVKAKTISSGITPIERLKIAFQADGSYCTDTNSSIRFSFAKERKITRMKSLLDECGLDYKTYNLSDGRTEFNIKVNSENFLKNFSWVNLENLCGLWCQGFLDELKHWDSSIRSKDHFKFDTTSAEVIEVVEYISIAAGYGIYITSAKDDRSENFSDVFTAHITVNNKVGGQSWVNQVVDDYSGKVYCVKVPSGKVIVKRNKCTMVCGNSGDPVNIICGTKPFGEGVTPQEKGSIEILWEIFGGEVNEQGYKVLDSHIGLIYGDSITIERCEEILKRLEAKGFATTSVVFGVGSYTSQYVTRDTLGSAIKATWALVDDKPIELFKDPVTDDGTKKSAKGLLRVELDNNGDYSLVDQLSWDEYIHESDSDQMRVVFSDGIMYNQQTFTEIRERIWC